MICALLWAQSAFISVHLQDIELMSAISVSYSNYADVFLKKEASWLFTHEKHDYAIEINEEEPLHESLYNLSETELNILKKYLDDVLVKNWIKYSVSSVNTSVLFVSKKDKDLKLCVNYWDLNHITIKNQHSLSLISEILNWLSEAKIFIKLDLKDAYHCIWIQQGNKWKTVFHTHYSHFKYIVMLFKLINASVIFQIYINWVFISIVNSLCVVYLNDILIYSHDKEKHKHHVHKVLEWLYKFKLYINLKKCTFFTNNVKFLRFMMSINDVTMNSQRIEIIENWSTSKNFHEVQIFLEFVNFYWQFIEAYSQIASSLISLLKESKNEKKIRPFQWSNDVKKMFSRLKEVFMTASVLVHFNSELKSQMKTDTSEQAITEIYTQLQKMSELWHSVTYWLRKLMSAEINYKTHNLKLLVIVETFKQWCHYLEGSWYSVEILTDHNNLQSFMKVKVLNERQAQWAVKLVTFDFVIMHWLSKTNSANVLLRHSDYCQNMSKSVKLLLLTLQRKLMTMSATLLIVSVTVSWLKNNCQAQEEWAQEEQIDMKIRNSQTDKMSDRLKCKESLNHHDHNIALALNSVAETVDCRQLVSCLLIMKLTDNETAYSKCADFFLSLVHSVQEMNVFVQEQKALIVKSKHHHNTEFFIWTVNFKRMLHHQERLYISSDEAIRAELLKHHHDNVLIRHFNIVWTQELLSCKYYWHELSEDVKKYVFSCDMCQKIKVSRHHSYSDMQSLLCSTDSWKKMIMNMITDLSLSKCRDNIYDAILVMIDHYTKMTRYFSTINKLTAVKLTDMFFKHIVLQYRISREIVSNQESIFTSSYWSEVCYQVKMKCWLSIIFHS